MKNGTSDPIISAICQRFTRQIRFEQFIERQQSGSGVAAPSAETRAVRNFFLSSIERPLVIFVSSKKTFAARTAKLSSPFGTEGSSQRNAIPCFPGLLDIDLIAKRNRRDERLDFVKAIAAPAKNFQRKIDLRGSENLHNLQFVLSFRAKSRNLLSWSKY